MKLKTILFFLLIFSINLVSFGQKNESASINEREAQIDNLKKQINTKDSLKLAKLVLDISKLYFQNNEYAESLEYSLKATKLANALKNDTLKVIALMQTTQTYLNLKDMEMAWQTLEETQGYFNRLKNKVTLAELYLLFAELYYIMEEYEATLSYINLALKQAKLLKSEYWQAQSFLSLGRLANEQQENQKALDNLEKAYKFFQSDSLSEGFLEVSLALAQNYQQRKEFLKAKKYLETVYPIAQKFDKPIVLMNIYEMYAYGAEQENKTDSALYFYKKFKVYHDSVFAQQKHHNIIHIQSLYDLDKKDAQIQVKSDEAKQQTQIRNLSFLFVALITILLYVVYRKNLQQSKNQEKLQKQNASIALQKKEITKQKESIETRTRLLSIKNTQIEKRNKNIIDSLNYAQRIQQAMLPSMKQVFGLLPHAFIFFKPRDIVSGDFYWVTERNHQIVLVVADCTGHGVPGAIMSVIGNNLLHEIIIVKGITEADKILNELHAGIRRVLKQDETRNRDGMDVAVCVIDNYPQEYEDVLGEREIQFAGAHNPLMYFQGESELITIKGDRYAIGGYLSDKVQDFTKHSIPLKDNTTFYVFSDGYQDQFGKNGRKFGKKRLRQLFTQIHKEPVEKQKQTLEKNIEDWRQGHRQMDDMLIIGVKVNK